MLEFARNLLLLFPVETKLNVTHRMQHEHIIASCSPRCWYLPENSRVHLSPAAARVDRQSAQRDVLPKMVWRTVLDSWGPVRSRQPRYIPYHIESHEELCYLGR